MAAKRIDAGSMEQYKNVLKTVWGTDQRIIDYCIKKTDDIVTLPNGMYFTIEKRKIETYFCFGYSDSRYDTKDYDDANRMAYHAAHSQDYFISENLKEFDQLIEALNEGNNLTSMPVLRPSYPGYDCGNLNTLEFYRTANILDDQGGSAHLEALKGTIAYRCGNKNTPYYILTEEDKKIIRDAINAAKERHEKKVRAYLKRYGMSKVHAWSYWQDE